MERDYIVSTESTFKTRYGGHKYSLAHKKQHLNTELSKYVWKAREKGEDPQISRKVLHTTGKPVDKPQKVCSLCILERIEIAEAKRERALNKRSELTGSCVHYRKLCFWFIYLYFEKSCFEILKFSATLKWLKLFCKRPIYSSKREEELQLNNFFIRSC